MALLQLVSKFICSEGNFVLLNFMDQLNLIHKTYPPSFVIATNFMPFKTELGTMLATLS